MGQSSMWKSFESGLHVMGVLLLGVLLWPLFLPISSGAIIVIEAAWIVVMVVLFNLFRKNRRRQ